MSSRIEWCICALIASIKLLPLLVALIVLPGLTALPGVETHTVRLPPQAHIMLFEGTPAYSYGTEWTVEIPAPSQKPSSVDIRELSTYVYKHLAYNSGPAEVAGGFKDVDVKIEFVLEGILLGETSTGLPDRGFVLQPGEYFWGPTRPKVTEKARGRVSDTGGWPDPVGVPTWTLTVRAVSHFDMEASGPLWFGQSLRQRVKAQVRYVF